MVTSYMELHTKQVKLHENIGDHGWYTLCLDVSVFAYTHVTSSLYAFPHQHPSVCRHKVSRGEKTPCNEN